MVTVDSSKGLFNEYGIRRPYDELEYKIGNPNWGHRFGVPQFFGRKRFLQILERFWDHLPVGSRLPSSLTFQAYLSAIVEVISKREDVGNIFNGPCLPLVFAAGAIQTDLGAYLENTVLAGVKSAYESQFKGGSFRNYCQGELTGRVNYVPESNFKLLLEAMDAGPVVAAYFPDALRGWPILAAREQMAILPSDLKFVLPDAIIHGHAIIGYPDVMARDFIVPGQYCAANTWLSTWRSPEYSLYFKAYGGRLDFGYTDNLAVTSDCHSAGLLLLLGSRLS